MTKKNNMSENQRIENILLWNFNIRMKQCPIQHESGIVSFEYILNLLNVCIYR